MTFMSTRFCSTCAGEVEVLDGACMLGHPVRLDAPMSSLAELRAEVDAAFEAARAQVTTLLVDAPAEPQVEALRQPPRHAGEQPGRRAVPPPPPPPADPVGSLTLPPMPAGTEVALNDPIASFAPAPRMDWGPQEGKLRRLRRSRRD